MTTTDEGRRPSPSGPDDAGGDGGEGGRRGLGEGAPADAAVPSRRSDAVTAVLSVWFTAGLLLDAWAHNNLAGLESFFTPWHAVFYSGFAATAAWLAWSVRRALLAPLPLRQRWERVPGAHRPALVAVVTFGLAGVGDLVWHTLLGIEQQIQILFSPTHLVLAVSMLLIVTTPLRSARDDTTLGREPGLRALLPAVVGLGLATSLVLLFLQYANALVRRGEGWVVAFSNSDDLFTAWVMSSMVVTTLVLVVPVLHLARTWRLPPGAVTVLVLPPAALSLAIGAFVNRGTVLTVLVAVGLAELVVVRLRPGPDRRVAVLELAAVLPALVWALVTLVAVLRRDGGATLAGLQPEIVFGAPSVQGLVGLLAGFAMLPPRTPAGAA